MLYEALAVRKICLINDPDQYRHCHHLPECYPVIERLTPRSVWLKGDLNIDRIMGLLTLFGDHHSVSILWRNRRDSPSDRPPNRVHSFTKATFEFIVPAAQARNQCPRREAVLIAQWTLVSCEQGHSFSSSRIGVSSKNTLIIS